MPEIPLKMYCFLLQGISKGLVGASILFTQCFHLYLFGLGTFPRKVTFVGFPFKAKRILMHMSMFKDLISDCQYESVDITAELLKKLNKRLNTNMQLPRSDVTSPEIDRATYDSFVSDRHGCSAELLTKRLQRNPFHSIPPYYASCPLLRPYFGPCHNKHFEP